VPPVRCPSEGTARNPSDFFHPPIDFHPINIILTPSAPPRGREPVAPARGERIGARGRA